MNANRLETILWLLERKDVEGKELVNLPKYDLNEETLDGRTALWQAAYKVRRSKSRSDEQSQAW